MKNLNEIQSMIKNKQNICLILCYDEILSNYTKNFSPENFNPMIKRILENFVKKDFIKIVIVVDTNEEKYINRLKLSAKNLQFHLTNDIDIASICKDFDREYLPIYFGDNIDITKQVAEKNGHIISVNYTRKEVKKLVDLQVSKATIEEFLVDTNNLYL